jgi:large subunit ribosomal protein L10
MPTEAKSKTIDELSDKLQRAAVAILIQTQGLNVKDMTELRNKLRSSNVEVKVAKNTLLRIAAERNHMTALNRKMFEGQTTVVFGYDDEVATAKAISDYIRTSKVVVLKSAILGGNPLSATEVENLAKLPGGKQQTRADVVGTVQGPLSHAYGLLTAPLRDLCFVLQARADQLKSGTSATE